ncbi:MAG: hypothetical protein ABSF24_09600 [Candidatus Bathyarchaeia archaeon]|jgi:hypothetical protein
MFPWLKDLPLTKKRGIYYRAGVTRARSSKGAIMDRKVATLDLRRFGSDIMENIVRKASCQFHRAV